MSELSASHLSVRLENRSVLDNVCTVFRTGQVTAVIGSNGAGKSTLLSCLAGLRKPTSGEARLDDKPVLTIPSRLRARQIGFIQQSPEVAWAIDVETLVGLGRTAHSGAMGLSPEDRDAIRWAMATADVQELRNRDVTTLSGGERGRVLLARALAGKPTWLLADEPFAGLDPRHQLEAADIFRKMASEHGQGVVVTLHDLSLAARMADKVVVLSKGVILAEGSPETALSPVVLEQAYQVKTRFIAGEAGALIEVVSLSD